MPETLFTPSEGNDARKLNSIYPEMRGIYLGAKRTDIDPRK